MVVTDEFVYCVDVTCLGTIAAGAVDKHEARDRAYNTFPMAVDTTRSFLALLQRSLGYKLYF